MAEVQISEPQFGDPFTDRGWRAAGAGRTGVLDDFDGSAFGLTLPAEGNTVEIGSTTQPSRLAVDGYGLEIAEDTTQSLIVPASATGGTTGRTDLIVGRLNIEDFTGDPGPLRLYRIEGTEGSLTVPPASYDPVGVRDLVLYAIRRRQGEGLNQAIVTDMRTRLGYNYDVPSGGLLPVNAPLGSRAARGNVVYRRDTVDGSVQWVEEWRAREVVEGTDATAEPGEGFLRRAGCRMVRKDDTRTLTLVVWKGSPARNPNPVEDGELRVAKLWDQDDPIAPDQVALSGWAIDQGGESRAAMGYISPSGWITWHWASTNNPFGDDGRDKTLVLHGTWDVA